MKWEVSPISKWPWVLSASALIVAVLALVLVLGQSLALAREQNERDEQARARLDAWKSWSLALYTQLEARGWNPPPLPTEPSNDEPRPEKAPLRPASAERRVVRRP